MAVSKLLGVLGGLGPAATVYFYELLTTRTKALCDQDHIDMVISSRATTPDRTAYILGRSDENPLDVMISEAVKLQEYGADLIVMPCNTAHYFFDEISRAIDVPMLNIIEETVKYCTLRGYKKVGIMATDGTLDTSTYQMKLTEHGLDFALPDADSQRVVMDIIYQSVKRGKTPSLSEFSHAADSLWSSGCDCVILGCTELSLVKREYKLDDRYVDSMEVLAESTIRACGKQPLEPMA